MNAYETILMMLGENNGMITSKQVTEAGIQRRTLSELVGQERIYRAARGIYALPEAWEDEMYFLQHRFSKGIYSHETALYLHGLSDRVPLQYTLTFPHGYNASGIRGHSAKARFVTVATHDLGVVELRSQYGNLLRAYDIERTLCDVVKGNNTCDIQIVNQAMKGYAASRDKDIGKLVSYAEQLRVLPKVRQYMEVLL